MQKLLYANSSFVLVGFKVLKIKAFDYIVFATGVTTRL